jgi:hypothetical protein
MLQRSLHHAVQEMLPAAGRPVQRDRRPQLRLLHSRGADVQRHERHLRPVPHAGADVHQDRQRQRLLSRLLLRAERNLHPGFLRHRRRPVSGRQHLLPRQHLLGGRHLPQGLPGRRGVLSLLRGHLLSASVLRRPDLRPELQQSELREMRARLMGSEGCQRTCGKDDRDGVRRVRAVPGNEHRDRRVEVQAWVRDDPPDGTNG